MTIVTFVRRLCNDASPEIQEQAMSILCNLAADEQGVDFVFTSMDTETLANCIIVGLESSNEGMTLHVIPNFSCLATLTNTHSKYRQHASWGTSQMARGNNKTLSSITRTSSMLCMTA